MFHKVIIVAAAVGCLSSISFAASKNQQFAIGKRRHRHIVKVTPAGLEVDKRFTVVEPGKLVLHSNCAPGYVYSSFGARPTSEKARPAGEGKTLVCYKALGSNSLLGLLDRMIAKKNARQKTKQTAQSASTAKKKGPAAAAASIVTETMVIGAEGGPGVEAQIGVMDPSYFLGSKYAEKVSLSPDTAPCYEQFVQEKR